MLNTALNSVAEQIGLLLRQPITVGHLVMAAVIWFLVHDVRKGGQITKFMQPKERELALMAKFGVPGSAGYVLGYFTVVTGPPLVVVGLFCALVILFA